MTVADAVAVVVVVVVVVVVELVPPGPAQVNTYVVSALNAPVLCVPLVATAPDHPPDAVHDVALVELHVSDEVPPPATLVGFAANVTVGAGPVVDAAVGCGEGAVTGTDPEPPQAASVSATALVKKLFKNRI